MLSLENRFVFAALEPLGPDPGALRFSYDPRRLRVRFDADSGMVSAVTEVGDVDLGQSVRMPARAYGRELSKLSFDRLWKDRSRQRINQLGQRTGNTASPTGLSFEFPSPLPRPVQSLLGPGGPALRVSGSENIRISGTSNWTNQQVGPLGQKRSLFPSLDMQQDLNIQLEGQLSDRIKVNLLQNSANQIPLANRIAINYKGDEDDVVQELDLGNTNLTLPGTQYVSYSGKNEGLFGIKTTARVGALDWTILASKQEGRSERASYAGGASRQTQSLRDLDYVRGVYFMLYDPNGPAYDIDESSIRLYLDDYNTSNDENSIRCRAMIDPTQLAIANSPDSSAVLGNGPVSVRGTFSQLNPGAEQDYEVLTDVYGPEYPVIRLTRAVSGEQRLAVSYRRRLAGTNNPYEQVGGQDTTASDGTQERILKLLRAPSSLLTQNSAGNFDTTLALYPSRELEMKNFYQLPGQKIDPTSMKIEIRQGTDDPPVTFLTKDGESVPYIEVLGLDNFDETSGVARKGHDEIVDGTSPESDTRLFVDYDNGVLFFWDMRPFAPRLDRPFEQRLDALLNRRARLDGSLGPANQPNPVIYDKHNLQRDTDGLYYIDVEFTAARAGGEITLGRGNILEGSEVVTVSGQTWVRDRDYTIDYDLGRLTLKRQLGPADNLNVDYSYAPLFQQAGRTLIGSAFHYEGLDRRYGGAFMYESKGAQDLRPRLGEEPSRSVIGDLNTDLTFRPDWITRLVDKLPGVRTTAPSDLRVQAEVGASFPNPNTQNEVYIDDMEGVRDAVTLALTPDRWRLSSVPSRAEVETEASDQLGPLVDATVTEKMTDLPAVSMGELHWYSPYSVVHESDLKPNLTNAQGSQNIRTVLALSVPRRPITKPASDSLWAGLTYSLDNAGIDLSQAQFIDLWVSDFRDRHNVNQPTDRVRGLHVKLHLDLGVVGEDQMRAPDRPPDNALNSEDKPPRDNQLVVTDANNEDTGYDNLLDKDENPADSPDLSTVRDDDPAGDDYRRPDDAYKEIDPRRFQFINGTEKNKELYPYPNTEDLDLNNNLDTAEHYFEYTIDLGDDQSPYLVTDVYRDYSGASPPPANPVQVDNGWRRYRIPIGDAARVRFGGDPNLSATRHLRVWLEGMMLPDAPPDANNLQRPLVMLGGLEIVGSRWREADLDSAGIANGTTVTLNSVNTLDDAEIYTPPFDPGQTRSGSEELTRREQSLALEFTNLTVGSRVEAFKTFSIDEDYTRYGKLSWYARGVKLDGGATNPNNEGLWYFVRFAPDERASSYYEYRAPLPTNWSEVRLDLTELANLKLEPDFPSAYSDTPYVRPRADGSGAILVVKGRPSFTRVRRVSVGILNSAPDSTERFSAGTLWFDELRALDVAKNVGHAQRLGVTGSLANLFRYNFSWNGRDADFITVGQSRGQGSSVNNINMNGTLDTQRFFEGTGITLPITYGYSRSSSQPRFTAGDDVVRTGPLASASETVNENRNWAVSYARNWGERSNPVLRYTLGGISGNLTTSQNDSRNPNSVVHSQALSAGVNYNIAPRNLLTFRLPIFGAKMYPLPERFYWNYKYDKRESQTFDRQTDTGDLVPRSPVNGEAAAVVFGADTRPFDWFHHSFTANRNLSLPNPAKHFGVLQIGRVVNWNQSMDARFALNRGPWLHPNFTWASRYTQDNRPEISPDLSVRQISNGQSITSRYDLPFGDLGRRAPGDTSKAGPALWRSMLSRFGNFSTDLALNWSSSYTRLVGIPSFAYLVGISRDPGLGGARPRMYESTGNQNTTSFDWRTGARTRVDLGLGASMQASLDMSSTVSGRNGVEHRRDTSRFPDIRLDYGRVATAIRLDRFLVNPRLNTAYNRSQTVDYSNNRTDKSAISTSSQWQPLLGLNGELKNGTRVELSIERRNTQREQLQLGRSITNDRNTDVTFSLNRTYSQGQKVRFLGRESTVRSSVSLGLTTVYSKRSGETLDFRSYVPRNPVNRDRLSVNATGSYGFSNNVTGNVSLGFGQERDLERDIITRNVRVELRAAFTF